MTDRHAGYIVTLAEDLREDDAQATINALRMVRGVIGVEPVVSGYELRIAQIRANDEWRKRISELLLWRAES